MQGQASLHKTSSSLENIAYCFFTQVPFTLIIVWSIDLLFIAKLYFYSVSHNNLAVAYTKLAKNYQINFSLTIMHSEIQFEFTPQHF